MWKPKILRQRLVCLRRSCQYSERFLIEVNCNVDTAIYKWKPTRRTEWKIIEKCNQKVECTDNGLTVDIEGLMAMLSCGEVTAKKIADYAEARVIVGRRVLYNVDKIKKYLDAMAV